VWFCPGWFGFTRPSETDPYQPVPPCPTASDHTASTSGGTDSPTEAGIVDYIVAMGAADRLWVGQSDVVMVAVRWYLRYGLSYRDVEQLLAETRYRRRPREPCSGGYRGSPHCWPTPPSSAVIHPVTGGWSTGPT
jgi:hypothetical protein